MLHYDNITYRYKGMGRDALTEFSVGMAGFADRKITSLSGGELQLVRIARALAQEARYLILDEPTDMLDPAHAVAVAKTMRCIAVHGGGILLSTHDISFALAVSDRVALLKDGRIQSAGSARKVVIPFNLEELFAVPFALASLPEPVYDLS
jgi:iron complex transport system ATP-binding protein